MEKDKSSIGVLAAVTVLMVPDIAFNGWALSVAWAWFIAPVIGMDLTLAQATGFVLFKVIAYPTKPASTPDTAKGLVGMVLESWLNTLLALGIGLVGHAVMS